MEPIKITQIFTIKINQNNWIAKTTFYSPAKTDIEIKGESEANAYSKLMTFLKIEKIPFEVKTEPNGNTIYNF